MVCCIEFIQSLGLQIVLKVSNLRSTSSRANAHFSANFSALGLYNLIQNTTEVVYSQHNIQTSQLPAPNTVGKPQVEYSVTDHVFLGPIPSTPLDRNIYTLSCPCRKALLEVPMSATPNGRQLGILCKIDSGETNIIPETMFRQLQRDSTTLNPLCIRYICIWWNGNPKRRVL